MSFYFEFPTVIIECLSVHIFFNGWYGLKHCSRMKTTLYWIAFYFFQCTISLIDIHPIFRMIGSLLLVISIINILYNVNKTSSFYSALLYITLCVVSEYLSLVLLNFIGYDVEILLAEGNTRVVFLVLAKTVQLIVILTAASVLRKNRTALSLKQVLPLLPCLMISIFICDIFFSSFSEYDESRSNILLIAVMGLLYINGIIVLYTQSIKKAVFEAEEQKLAMQQYEMQAQYYQSVINDREETRALWHDIKKRVTAIESLVISSDNQNAREEYTKLQHAFDDVGKVVDIGNTVLDAIFYHNIERAKSMSIPVSLDACVSHDISISAVDLNIIIGNTFDNALEECALFAETKPKIKVSLFQKNDMLFYEIVNPCAQATYKKPGSIHGYGLQNVRRCVNKYNGSMSSGVEEGQYRVSIRLECILANPE